ncbi:hypothetical protein GY45DRAFT_620168 [Cubamyces sp. BRFM 1775]|nr:hypothetical protein GY45DRAFT_620168 [Cubamyces sp. BRFM 1775]
MEAFIRFAVVMQEVLRKFENTFTSRRVRLDDLPAELIHQILLLAPQSSVLSFGLTNRRNYVLSLPALHHRIILTERTLPLLHFPKIAQCDPALRWVQELQLGGASDDASGWDVLGDASILTVFPNLRFVDARRHTPVRGWTGILHVVDTLPSTTKDFRGKAFCLGDSNIWTLDRIFPSYDTLMLAFVGALGQQPHITSCDIVPTLATNFPNLTTLSLSFPCVPGNISRFLNASYFPSLRTFTLSLGLPIWSHPPHDLKHASSFVAFISRHSHTLLDLHLPTWTFEEDVAPAFASLVSSLKHLHSCFHTAVLVAQSPSFAEAIRTLHISRCSHHSLQSGLTPAWVQSTVRQPYPDTSTRRPDDINSLPGLVRMLHNFTSRCSSPRISESVHSRTYCGTAKDCIPSLCLLGRTPTQATLLSGTQVAGRLASSDSKKSRTSVYREKVTML